MTSKLKHATCPSCKGTKQVRSRINVQLTIGPSGTDVSSFDDNTCWRCSSTGTICMPPFGNGSLAKMPEEKMKLLARAGTDMRCLSDPYFIQRIAHVAADVMLPIEDAKLYCAYWEDNGRDVNLGEFIFQVAERAEAVASMSLTTQPVEKTQTTFRDAASKESSKSFEALATAKPDLEHEEILDLVNIAKTLDCTTHPLFIQGIATKAARITLPNEEVERCVSLGANAIDDQSLEAFIRIVAQYAEVLAMRQYGTTNNGFFAAPRPAKADSFDS